MTFEEWCKLYSIGEFEDFSILTLRRTFQAGDNAGYKRAIETAMVHLECCKETYAAELLKSLLDPDPEQG